MTTTLHGKLTAPTTLELERVLPGPIERVWRYLTDSDHRARWLASGVMPAPPDTDFELVWRNDELTSPPGARPDGFDEENRMTCRLLESDAPRRLVYTFGDSGRVCFDLTTRDDGQVLLRLTHDRLPDRHTTVMVSSGWHAHLDVLQATLDDQPPTPFWDNWTHLRDEYDERLPGA